MRTTMMKQLTNHELYVHYTDPFVWSGLGSFSWKSSMNSKLNLTQKSLFIRELKESDVLHLSRTFSAISTVWSIFMKCKLN